MTFRRWTALSLTFGLVLASGAIAQEEPQVVRQELMKRNGEAMGVMGKMVKGETEFDADAVMESLATIEEVAIEFPTHFPEGSETGHETEALPAIWENKADFEAKAQGLAEDARAAMEAAPTDVATLQPVMEQLGENCSGCHEDYRQKKE